MSFQSVVIIGAPRSGTNMLRDVLTQIGGVATWPCDEINYIWRHGNIRFPTDEFSVEMARPEVKQYIRRQFEWISNKCQAQTVIEKTCANSLRVPFIDAVLPDTKFVFIYRDGLDVVGSAMKRWKAELDIPYLARKTRFVPITDLPYYGGRYFWNRIYRLFSNEERLAFWGPKFTGQEEVLQKHSLEEVCAIQWKRCVDLSEEAFKNIDPRRIVRVGYEEFVSQPESELGRIIKELGLSASNEFVKSAIKDVSAESIGKGRKSLDQETTDRIKVHIKDSLERYGYA